MNALEIVLETSICLAIKAKASYFRLYGDQVVQTRAYCWTSIWKNLICYSIIRALPTKLAMVPTLIRLVISTLFWTMPKLEYLMLTPRTNSDFKSDCPCSKSIHPTQFEQYLSHTKSNNKKKTKSHPKLEQSHHPWLPTGRCHQRSPFKSTSQTNDTATSVAIGMFNRNASSAGKNREPISL